MDSLNASEVHHLTLNYRSTPQLLEVFNVLFSALLPASKLGVGSLDPVARCPIRNSVRVEPDRLSQE
jgi:ATP-dependent exoDNAse (exonuclease V) beta subunit